MPKCSGFCSNAAQLDSLKSGLVPIYGSLPLFISINDHVCSLQESVTQLFVIRLSLDTLLVITMLFKVGVPASIALDQSKFDHFCRHTMYLFVQ
jgi:hypothetical protein